MQISTAIELGRVMVREMTSSLFIRADGDCACAIGMAELAIGRKMHDDEAVYAAWPWLRELQQFTCPACGLSLLNEGKNFIGHVMGHVMGTISIGRDAYGDCKKTLTLDQLIAWVKSVEPSEIVELPLDIQLAECESVAVQEEAFAYG